MLGQVRVPHGPRDLALIARGRGPASSGLRQAGHTLTEVSEVVGFSITTVRRGLLQLGYELAERAGLEVDVAA
jgi:hypothetical protein